MQRVCQSCSLTQYISEAEPWESYINAVKKLIQSVPSESYNNEEKEQ